MCVFVSEWEARKTSEVLVYLRKTLQTDLVILQSVSCVSYVSVARAGGQLYDITLEMICTLENGYPRRRLDAKEVVRVFCSK